MKSNKLKIEEFSSSYVRISTFTFSCLQEVLTDDPQWFKQLIDNEVFMEGLRFSSKNLYNQIKNGVVNDPKLKLALLRYFIRACIRCTPFGLFGATSMIEHRYNNSNEKYFSPSNFFINSRLQPSKWTEIIENILRVKHLRNSVLFFINSSLYKAGNHYRYIEDNVNVSDEITQVHRDEMLDMIVKKCKKGTRYTFLIDCLVNEGYSIEDSENYIDSLIENKILITELHPSSILSYQSYENDVLQLLKNRMGNMYKDAFALPIIRTIEDSLRNSTISVSNSSMFSINTSAKSVLINDDIHIDLFFNSSNYLGSTDVSLIKEGAYLYNKILCANATSVKYERLDNFKKAFFSRYGEQEVPLTIALDVEIGLGYNNTLNSSGINKDSLIANFPFYTKSPNSTDLSWDKLDSLLIRLIEKANLKNEQEVYLSDSDVDKISKINETLGDGYLNSTGCVRFSMFNSKESGDRIIKIKSLSNESPNRILGRFNVKNPDIKSLSIDISEFEDSLYEDDTILAELDYVPQEKLANIMSRTKTRKYSISYFGKHDSSEELVNINDLYLIMKEEELVLFSKKIKKKIIPIISNAFDESSDYTLPIPQFLIDLSSQYRNNNNEIFSIEKYHNFYRYLPRIRYNNIIISQSSWFISEYDIFNNTRKEKASLDDVKNKLTKLNIPTSFLIVREDVELYININNDYLIEIFLQELKKNSFLFIKEFLLNEMDSVFCQKGDSNKQYNNEFFMPFKVKNAKDLSHKLIFQQPTKTKQYVQRSFPPGSEWIYQKIYCTNKSTNRILLKLKILLDILLEKGLVKKFFFVNYKDSKNHIRLRILLTDINNLTVVLKELNSILEEFSKNNYIQNIVLDTYDRELERYGNESIESFETIFFLDSCFSIKLIEKCKNNLYMHANWLHCIFTLDTYCKAFELNHERKIIFANQIKKQFDIEFSSNKNTAKYISTAYKRYEQTLISYFLDENNEFPENSFLREGVSTSIKHLDGYSEKEKFNFLSSLIHMHIIRMVGAQNNRLYEYLIYSFYIKSINSVFHIKKK